MKTVAIAIPIYKETLTPDELQSLKQCLRVLHKHPFVFFCSPRLNLDAYKKLLPDACDCKFLFFDDRYFKSVQAYNQLLLSLKFYKRFESYRFILIYQLDSFVFKDELEYWCNKGYDYIGAPWFEGFHAANSSSKILGGGNGGLSLRKTNGHLSFLKKIRRIEILRKYSKLTTRAFHKEMPDIFKEIYLAKESAFERKYKNQEDYFWTIDAPEFINQPFAAKSFLIDFLHFITQRKPFYIAPAYQALKFSFEVNPGILFKINKSLPFGCHAWERYDKTFWQEFILLNKEPTTT